MVRRISYHFVYWEFKKMENTKHSSTDNNPSLTEDRKRARGLTPELSVKRRAHLHFMVGLTTEYSRKHFTQKSNRHLQTKMMFNNKGKFYYMI